MVTRLKNLSARRAWTACGILLTVIALPVLAATFNLFQPAAGILKGNPSTYITTAATSADVVATFSGTCNSGTVLKGDGSCAAASTGTVTSVALTVPTGFSVSGSPVTTSGTFGVTTTLTGPLRGNGTGIVADSLSGVLKGNGTGAITTAAGTDVAAVFTGTCNSSTFLRGDGSCQSPGGGGTVTSVAMTVPSFLSVSGSPITNSGTLAVTLSGTALPVANGGTGTTTSTGTGNTVLSASPTFTGTVTAATVAATAVTVGGNNVCQSTGTNCPASSVAFSGATVNRITSNVTLGNGSTDVVLMNAEIVDTGNFHDNTTNSGRILFSQVTGKVQCTGSVAMSWSTLVASTFFPYGVGIRVNGSTIVALARQESQVVNTAPPSSITQTLNVTSPVLQTSVGTDYAELVAFSDNSDAAYTTATYNIDAGNSAGSTRFSCVAL